MSEIKKKMGTHAYYFSCFNPSGHYKLNLNKAIEREVAKNIIVLNKRVQTLIAGK